LINVALQKQLPDNVTCAIIRLIAHPELCNAARDWSP
jgi:serine/threonine protein phosphatase PrpC